MTQANTVERILDTAEVLFAQKGFAETSLRAITSKAGVNLAAVNYHFGSKEALIQAVFERFLNPFCGMLETRMDDSLEQSLTLEKLLGLVSRTALDTHRSDTRRVAIFFRLSGLAYTQAQGHMRRFLRERYGAVFGRFLHLLTAATPTLTPLERFWRVHFALGATTFALSGMESLLAISNNDLPQSIKPEQVNDMLLEFVAGGIRAPSEAS
ncbi:MAG: TetR family transcriptional regulator [Alcanivoracaceae bacterium]|nr:TetR family transcriptional regulator [Alcanivoracaceae bacterium]